MSLASRMARSSSSSISPLGSRRAALRSRRVAAITRNSVAWSRRQPSPDSSNLRINEMNSSVTRLKETSVISSLWREISWSRRSKGPSKLDRWTLKPVSAGIASGDGTGIRVFSTCEQYFVTCISQRITRRVATNEKRFLA